MSRACKGYQRRYVWIVVSLLVCIVCAGEVSAWPDARKEGLQEMNWLSDEEIVQRLGSRDSRESREAAEEVMNRGERVIPLLLKNRGDNRPYAWGSLGHPKSGAITFGPTNDETWDEGRIITVEAASIYIICALFYGNLDFGSSAYLRDSTPVEFNKYNTRARMERAWESVEIWFGQLQKESLESLRRRNDGPLSASGFHF